MNRRNAITKIGSFGADRVMYVHLPYESLLRCSSFCYGSRLPISTGGIRYRSAFGERISIFLSYFFFFYLFSFKVMMGSANKFLSPVPWMVDHGRAGGTVLVCDLCK